MAHSLSAKKRARQSLKRYARNKPVRTQVKSEVKKMRLAVADLLKKKNDPAQSGQETTTSISESLKKGLSHAYTVLDESVSKGVIHKNKAARLKSRLTLAANKIGI
ncbi:MAG: 30S ribosomal protein S20 [Planctomycetota bacterium]